MNTARGCRIGIDVGGTFTDFVLADSASRLVRFKEPSVPSDPSLSVARGLPRLIVWGKQDAISPLSEDRLDQFGGEVLLVEEAGHLPHVEAPRLVNERISEFLSWPSSC